MSDAPKKQAVSEAGFREEEVLSFWQEHNIFEKSVRKHAPKGDFVFYDGPPFATGLPHYGHILASTIKDAVPRYKTMQGYRVPRTWGWDCHGLPLENIIEKRLSLATKKDIEEFGVERFNEAARDAVLEYADDWKKIIPRMGRWVDMENDYKTMDASYTESVWWAFKELHRKGLVHEGFKSMHLCPRCGTTLSNFEVNQGYKDIKDIAVFVELPLEDVLIEEGEPQTSLIVWTTTPWTLPGNMAAAVHEEYTYAVVEKKDEGVGDLVRFVVAKERLQAVFGEDEYKIVKEISGAELVGKSYTPPFPYFKEKDIKGKEYAWKIYHASYVELNEGTGAVHLAPAYGEEDMELAQEKGIPVVHHVGEDGAFLPLVSDFSGVLVKPKDDEEAGVSHLDTDIRILRALTERDRLFKKENITHSYPHCWRCDTPLLNYATTSWFVRVPKIKDTLVRENEKIAWVPEHVGKNRFGNWLEGARDWAISRQRYWGAPLPIWKNKKTGAYHVMGSLEDIQQFVPKSGNTYFLMRHGEAESNVSGNSSTKIEAANPVTEKGKSEVRARAEELKGKHIDLVFVSPFQRTKETCAILKEELGLTDEQIITDERLGEIQLGDMDGSTMKEYHSFLYDGDVWCEQAPQGGESWLQVKQRVGAFLYEIEKTHTDKNILIISHNSPLRMLAMVGKGRVLHEDVFDHDEDEKRFDTGEVRELSFTPMPHNRQYDLDYHRPYIDEITLVEDGEALERVPDVFDCWFESGSMPYASKHYPFGSGEHFKPKSGWFKKAKGYPADFIAEGLDQTRGWFYSLLVLGTALFDRASFKHVIVNGLVLAEDGKKMSKSLQNYPDPMHVVDEYGADAIRFYLLSSPVIKGEDLNFSEKDLGELARKNIGRLHNVLSFYLMYQDESVSRSDASPHVLDQWMIARVHETARACADGFESYELDRATRPITACIDDLSVWYVRRSRERLKGGDEKDKMHALQTFRYVLYTLAQIMAPSMPFYGEHLFLQVREEGDPESVHLTVWPKAPKHNEESIKTMDRVRAIVSDGLDARTKAGIKVRQPLQILSIKESIDDLSKGHITLIQDEVNVKEVAHDPAIDSSCVLDTTISEDLQKEGIAREFIRFVQGLRKEKGLNPEDQITLTIATTEHKDDALHIHEKTIASVVGAKEVIFGETEGEVVEIEGITYTVDLRV